MKPRGEFNCPYSLFRPELKDTFGPEASSDPADMHGFNYPLRSPQNVQEQAERFNYPPRCLLTQIGSTTFLNL